MNNIVYDVIEKVNETPLCKKSTLCRKNAMTDNNKKDVDNLVEQYLKDDVVSNVKST
jgi:hypothetical protein